MTTLTKNCTPDIGQNLNDIQHGLYQSLQQWFRIQRLKFEVSNERTQLLLLSDDKLRDLGITRSEAVAEAFRVDLPVERLNHLKSKKC